MVAQKFFKYFFSKQNVNVSLKTIDFTECTNKIQLDLSKILPGIALIQIRLLILKYLCMAVLTDFSLPSLEHVVRVLTNGSLITPLVRGVLAFSRP